MNSLNIALNIFCVRQKQKDQLRTANQLRWVKYGSHFLSYLFNYSEILKNAIHKYSDLKTPYLLNDVDDVSVFET